MRASVLLAFSATVTAVFAVDAPASACSCDPLDEFVDIQLEETTLNGVAQPPREKLTGRLIYHPARASGGKFTPGAAFSRPDRETVLYVHE